MKTEREDALRTVTDVAHECGYSRTIVLRALANGELCGEQLSNGVWVVRASAVARWMESWEVAS